MNDLHRQILKKFHTLCTLNGLPTEAKCAIVASYGVQSSADMQTHDLIDVCGALQKQLDERTGASSHAAEMDKLRKRCLRAVCEYIDARGIAAESKIEYAKQMACRSAKKESFNRLTAAELRGVIGYFNKERETMRNAESVAMQAEVDYMLKHMRPVGVA